MGDSAACAVRFVGKFKGIMVSAAEQNNNNNALTIKIAIGLLLGFAVGCGCFYLFKTDSTLAMWVQTYLVDGVFHTGGKIFVNLLKMMIVPLVFVSLVCGVASTDELSSLGRIGLKTFLIYLFTTAVAITLALVLATVINPGLGVDINTPDVAFSPKEPPSLVDVVIGMFPSNPIAAMSNGIMLQVIVFAVFVGAAVTSIGEPGMRLRSVFEDLNVLIMRLVHMIMQLAPYGVFFLVAKVFADKGPDILAGLGKYVLTVIAALFLHALVTYSALVKFLARVSPLVFLSKMREALLFAFSTASSAATMPITLRLVEQRLGVSNRVASFTIPLGTTVNMDGTAIMQGVATVFIAGAYGVDLTLGNFLMIITTATLASIGTAAVPSAGMITLAMVLAQVNLPAEAIGLILGVDRILDMLRTAVNVTGDAAVTLAVARTEGALDKNVFDERDTAPKIGS